MSILTDLEKLREGMERKTAVASYCKSCKEALDGIIKKLQEGEQ